MLRRSTWRLLIVGRTPEELAANAGLPSADGYRKMSVKDLLNLIETREDQIKQIRTIYEGMMYNSEKALRRQMLEHDDQRYTFFSVHNKVQTSARKTHQETVRDMRDNEFKHEYEKRLIIMACIASTLMFWMWCRRHYLNRGDIGTQAETFISGFRVSERDYLFRSKKWTARSIETEHDTEVRLRKEEQQKKQQEETLRH
jgi:hypothetical protein